MKNISDLSSITRHPAYQATANAVDTLMSQHPGADMVDRQALIAECLGLVDSMKTAGSTQDLKAQTIGHLLAERVFSAVTAGDIAHDLIEQSREPRYTRDALNAAASMLGLSSSTKPQK